MYLWYERFSFCISFVLTSIRLGLNDDDIDERKQTNSGGFGRNRATNGQKRAETCKNWVNKRLKRAKTGKKRAKTGKKKQANETKTWQNMAKQKVSQNYGSGLPNPAFNHRIALLLMPS